MKECGVFFAFSDEQFQSNKTPLAEGEKYVAFGAGSYLPKSSVEKFSAGIARINSEFKKEVRDNKAREAHILYELKNHEAFYVYDIEDTLQALGEDYSKEEVQAVFKKYQEQYS